MGEAVGLSLGCTVCGGIIGSILLVAGWAVQPARPLPFFQTMFGLTADTALNEAYAFLGADATASTSEINQLYRKLAKQYHPDREGGSQESFVKLTSYMELIRDEREGASAMRID